MVIFHPFGIAVETLGAWPRDLADRPSTHRIPSSITITAALATNRIVARTTTKQTAVKSSAGFRHRVRWNRAESRIEMHLESLREQYVRIPAAKLLLHFARGETIHTENSYKFTQNTISALLDDAGFKIEQMWKDPLEWYALRLAGPQ